MQFGKMLFSITLVLSMLGLVIPSSANETSIRSYGARGCGPLRLHILDQETSSRPKNTSLLKESTSIRLYRVGKLDQVVGQLTVRGSALTLTPSGANDRLEDLSISDAERLWGTGIHRTSSVRSYNLSSKNQNNEVDSAELEAYFDEDLLLMYRISFTNSGRTPWIDVSSQQSEKEHSSK